MKKKIFITVAICFMCSLCGCKTENQSAYENKKEISYQINTEYYNSLSNEEKQFISKLNPQSDEDRQKQMEKVKNTLYIEAQNKRLAN